jgi:hypothetical protein
VLIEPHMPAAKRLGRRRATELRSVLDAILYIARTGVRSANRNIAKVLSRLTSLTYITSLRSGILPARSSIVY